MFECLSFKKERLNLLENKTKDEKLVQTFENRTFSST